MRSSKIMGKLIVIEGLDGSGKSTQLNLLPERLNERGIDCKTVSFPNYESDSSALIKMYLSGKLGDKPSDVNAFAASAYGFGWLDAGVYLGYISAEETPEIVLEKKFPSELQEKLEEKTLRYQRMLTEALAAVSPAPDAACGIYAAVKMILHETEKGLREGAAFLPDDYVNSLVEFSYGYGWLDCGVRSGLFSIHGNRHLFTI